MEMEMTDVIAIRELRLIETDGRIKPVKVALGIPTPFEDSTDYYVTFQVKGLGSEQVFKVGGVDAFQALQLAMGVISAELQALNQECEGRLEWEHHDDSNFGFPQTL